MPRKYMARRKPLTHRRKAPFKRRSAGVKRVVKKMEQNKVTTCTLSRGIKQLFPDRFQTRLRAVIPILWTGVSGAINAFVIAGNGLHLSQSSGPISGTNPFITGTATNIYGLGNVLSADASFASTGPYLNYRVVSSSIRLNTQNTSAAAADASDLVIFPVTANTIAGLPVVNATVFAQTSEFPYATYRSIAGTTTNKGVNQSARMSTARMYALKYKASLETAAFTGSFGVNPSNIWYWVLLWYPDSAVTTTGETNVTVEYWCEFFNRNTLASTSG